MLNELRYMIKYETIKSHEYLFDKLNCPNDFNFYEIDSYYYIQFKTDPPFYYKIKITDDIDNKNFECLSKSNNNITFKDIQYAYKILDYCSEYILK